MIGKLVKGSGFRGAANYLLTGKTSTSGTRGVIIASNMAGTTPRQLASEFGAFRKLRPTLGKAVFHASLSPSPQDRTLTNTEFADLARRYLNGMGFTNCPFVIVRHDDTDHAHIHLLASRITTSGEVVSDKQDFKRSETVIRQLESEFGLSSLAPSTAAAQRRNTMHPKQRKHIEARLDHTSREAEAALPGNEPDRACTPFGPSDEERKTFKRRLLESEYEQEVAEALAEDVAFIKRGRYGLLIHTCDGGLIVDKGDAITAKKMTDEAAASRVVALAVAKGWCGVELSGSRDFVRHAMRHAMRSGLAIHPKDADQRQIHDELMREMGGSGNGDHDMDVRPLFAQRLSERRRQVQESPLPSPSRGFNGGL